MGKGYKNPERAVTVVVVEGEGHPTGSVASGSCISESKKGNREMASANNAQNQEK